MLPFGLWSGLAHIPVYQLAGVALAAAVPLAIIRWVPNLDGIKLRRLGDISFALYVFHCPFLMFGASFLEPDSPKVLITASLSAALILATIVSYVVEIGLQPNLAAAIKRKLIPKTNRAPKMAVCQKVAL
jgi:peptidoglycan/LPS O-acetylase OafA/YrhL